MMCFFFPGGPVAKWEVIVLDAFCASSLAFQYILDCLHSRHTKTQSLMERDYLSEVEKILSKIHSHSMRFVWRGSRPPTILSLQYMRFEYLVKLICVSG